MNLQPVIHRELRVASRHRETWRLRLAFGIGALLAFSFGMLMPHVSLRERGMVVLVCLAVVGCALSLFTGAYLTADSITEEKREGTLGLLFLTPLKGWQIVTGKLATHSLQVGYALLGGIPVFFLPLLIGGVGWAEAARVLLSLFATVLLSLCVGVFWSARVRDVRSAVLATVITMLLIALLPWGWFALYANFSHQPTLNGFPQLSPITTLLTAFEDNYQRTGSFGGPKGPPGAYYFWSGLTVNLFAAAVLMAITSVTLQGLWRRAETAAASRPAEASPVAPGRPTRRTQAAKQHWPERPLHWLMFRALSSPKWLKVVRGLTLALFLAMLMACVLDRGEGWFAIAVIIAIVMHLLARVELVMAATRRITEDRKSGALEVILVTPIDERELVAAHHDSLRRASRVSLALLWFLSLALVLMMILWRSRIYMSRQDVNVFSVLFLGGAVVSWFDFAAIRWFALRESLRAASQMKAVGKILGIGLAVSVVTFFSAFLLAISQSGSFTSFMFHFIGWYAFCVVFDLALIGWAKISLDTSLRRLVSER